MRVHLASHAVARSKAVGEASHPVSWTTCDPPIVGAFLQILDIIFNIDARNRHHDFIYRARNETRQLLASELRIASAIDSAQLRHRTMELETQVLRSTELGQRKYLP